MKTQEEIIAGIGALAKLREDGQVRLLDFLMLVTGKTEAEVRDAYLHRHDYEHISDHFEDEETPEEESEVPEEDLRPPAF